MLPVEAQSPPRRIAARRIAPARVAAGSVTRMPVLCAEYSASFSLAAASSNDVARRLPSRSYRTAAVADCRRPSPTVAATLVSHHHHPHHRQFYWRHTHGVIARTMVCACVACVALVGVMCIAR